MAVHDLEASVTDNGDYLTPEEAAKILKVSKYTIIRRCEQHQLPAIKLGHKWRISFHGLQVQAEANLLNGHISDEAHNTGEQLL